MQTPDGSGLSMFTFVAEAAAVDPSGFWSKVAPIAVGVVLAAVFALVTQLVVVRLNRRVNREERHMAHLEKAVTDLMTVCQEVQHAEYENVGEYAPEFRSTRDGLRAALALTQGWAARCGLRGFEVALDRLDTEALLSRPSLVQDLREEGNKRWLGHISLSCSSVCAKWLKSPETFDPPAGEEIDRMAAGHRVVTAQLERIKASAKAAE